MPAEEWKVTYRLRRMADRLKIERSAAGEECAKNLVTPWDYHGPTASPLETAGRAA